MDSLLADSTFQHMFHYLWITGLQTVLFHLPPDLYNLRLSKLKGDLSILAGAFDGRKLPTRFSTLSNYI